MKYPIFLASALVLTLGACNQNTPQSMPPDNTGVNVRDRDDTETSFDQSEKEPDRRITQRIRQRLMDDKQLSTNAKNIKIITIDGRVTLRGPVKNEQEKTIILTIVQREPDVKSLDDQLDIAR